MTFDPWDPHPGDYLNPRSFRLRDDFSGGHEGFNQGLYGETGWMRVRTGDAGGEARGIASADQHPGIIRLVTSTTPQVCALVRGMNLSGGTGQNYDFIRPDNVTRFCWIARVPIGGNIRIRLGLVEDVTAANGGSNVVCFRYDSSVDANWAAVCRSGGSQSTVATTTTFAAGAWVRLRAFREPGTWHFRVGNGPSVTLSTNVPTAAFCQFAASVENTTTADRHLDLDFASLGAELSR